MTVRSCATDCRSPLSVAACSCRCSAANSSRASTSRELSNAWESEEETAVSSWSTAGAAAALCCLTAAPPLSQRPRRLATTAAAAG